MSNWQKALICLSVLLALALLGPASALAGGSAGDQQYIDPLGGHNPNPASHHSGSASTPSTAAASSSSSSSTPTTQTVASSTSSSTGTTAGAAGSGTSSTASSSAKGADPAGKTLPLTGFAAWAGAFVGLALLGTGLAVRRAARRTE